MQKKGELSLNLIVVAIILLIVAAIVIFAFRNLFGKSTTVANEQLKSLGDCDCDGLRNFQDKCPYQAADSNANPQYPGCVSGITNATFNPSAADSGITPGTSSTCKDASGGCTNRATS